jgi:hypothetical protein
MTAVADSPIKMKFDALMKSIPEADEKIRTAAKPKELKFELSAIK